MQNEERRGPRWRKLRRQRDRGVLLLLMLCSASLSAQDEEGIGEIEVGDSLESIAIDDGWDVDSQDVPNEAMLDEGEVDFPGGWIEGRYDSTELFLRSPAAGALDEYREDDRFDYDPGGGPEDRGFFEKIVDWIAEVFERLFGVGDAVQDVAGVIPYILFAIALGLVIWTVVRSNGGVRLFRRAAQREDIVFNEEIRDIHALDFPTLLNEALERKDYRSAVRIHYLQILQSLSSSGRIDWRPEKTNGEYLAELRSSTLYDPMRRLTLLFDYIWYGEFSIDRGEYESVRVDFEQTAGMLGREAKA